MINVVESFSIEDLEYRIERLGPINSFAEGSGVKVAFRVWKDDEVISYSIDTIGEARAFVHARAQVDLTEKIDKLAIELRQYEVALQNLNGDVFNLGRFKEWEP